MAGPPRAISGNQGFVLAGGSRIAEVTGWDATTDYGTKNYVSQSSVFGSGNNYTGYNKTVQGNTKMSGTIKGYLDPNFAVGSVLVGGALVALVLYEDYYSTPQSYWALTARIGTRTGGADIMTAEPVPFSATFDSDGLITGVNV